MLMHSLHGALELNHTSSHSSDVRLPRSRLDCQHRQKRATLKAKLFFHHHDELADQMRDADHVKCADQLARYAELNNAAVMLGTSASYLRDRAAVKADRKRRVRCCFILAWGATPSMASMTNRDGLQAGAPTGLLDYLEPSIAF